MLKDTLLQSGVPEGGIAVIPDERAAVDAALRMAETGDLLLIFADAITRSWKQVIHFRPEVQPPSPEIPATLSVEQRTDSDLPPEEAPGESEVLIRDERGVRLARDEED